jgi:uncharacterized protein YecE (DUF72 family)
MKKITPSPVYEIGCSGFHYPDWKGQFYPEKLAKSKWFEYYATHFNTVELNVTFYRTMKLSFFEGLYARSPEDFTFSVKAPRLVTHYKKFQDCKDTLDAFYGSVQEGLKDKLGAVLFQLPPSTHYSEETLERVIGCIDPAFENTVEFRHESWWRKDVYERLGKNNITFCTVGYPRLPETVVVNTPVVYARFHGSPKLYYSRYSDEFLQSVAKQLRNNPGLKKAYLYFDNTAEGWAVENAKEIRSLLGAVNAGEK